ncbi:MAG: sigma-70 family RNA polymerase sigma factor [Cytophagales bacterium]|nr:sigma-70 family RNA polymerase sigma factor [Cytophagales bacterium]
MEDKQILEQFRAEATRTAAFNTLVRKYQQRIYWHIRKMVIDHDDADDLTQEVFIKVWHHLADFRGDSQLYTWLYRIASNECLGFLNRKKRNVFTSIDDTIAEELTAKLDSSDLITGDEIQMKLQKALLRLPDKQRLVFNMRYYDELSYQEIAEITGTSEGALKASYHIAAKKIEEYITM